MVPAFPCHAQIEEMGDALITVSGPQQARGSAVDEDWVDVGDEAFKYGPAMHLGSTSSP
jgi:hypothetical protein